MKPSHNNNLSWGINLALLAALASGGAQAARLDGRVSDSSGTRYLGSAIVTIPELNLKTRTTRDGRYLFADVPAGSYTLVVDYVGATRVEESITVGDSPLTRNIKLGGNLPPVENVLVYGISAQQASAINQQRAADNIVSAITASDAGALPDSNIAEALQRAPGVFIERDQGEGRFVGIRGLSPSLSTVKINGINVPAPDADQRAVALDVVPSDLLENLEISKTFTPDMDGDFIGGTIEVKSLSGFDKDGQFYSFGTEAGYDDLVEEWSPKYDGTYSNIFALDELGEVAIAGSLSYQDRDFGSENIEHDGGWVAAEANGNFYPEQPELRDYAITRERFGAAFNIDWRPNDTSEYYLRTLYSDFEDDEIRNRIEIEPDEESGVIGKRGADFAEAEYTRSLKDRKETQDIISIALGGLNQLDDWTIDYAFGYSYAEEKEPDRHDSEFAGAEDTGLSYHSLGDYPNYLMGDAAYDPALFELDEIFVEDNTVEDEEFSLELNVARQFFYRDNPGEIKFGGKLRMREKERESDIDVYDDFGDDPILASQFAGGSADYDLRRFGFTLREGAIRNFTDALGDDSLNADATLTESTVGDYSIDEDVYAAYLMGTMDFGDITVIGGVRYELTEFDSDGALGTVYESETLDEESAGFGGSNQDGDYDHFLPSVLVRWDFSEDIVLRAAGSQTLARPSFGAINPSSLAEIEESDGETELQIEDLGNPDLDPYESINLDFSAEYYPEGDIGVLSAAVFYKDIEDYIAQANVADNLDISQWTSLVGLTPGDIDDADVLQYINGDDAEVLGLELAWYRSFENGLLLGANATFTDTEATFGDRDVDLPGSSDTIGNLVLGYAKHGFQARVALNYKSEALVVVGGDSSEDVYEDEHTQIDASISYDIMDGIQVYFEGVNLTDEPMFLYQDNDDYNWQYEEYGRTYLVGIRVSNF